MPNPDEFCMYSYCRLSPDEQCHVHEVQGSVKMAGKKETPHNHRFAAVSGEAVPCGEYDHVHEVQFRTDFYDGHFHEFCGKTSGAVPAGDRHVHFLASVTTADGGHCHEFRLTTFINDPTGD